MLPQGPPAARVEPQVGEVVTYSVPPRVEGRSIFVGRLEYRGPPGFAEWAEASDPRTPEDMAALMIQWGKWNK